MVSDKKIFYVSPLVEVHEMMMHTKYQGSMPCGFRQEYFFKLLPILVYGKHVTPGAGSFLDPGA